MFTGIVEEIGTINQITKNSKGFDIEINCKKIIDDVKFGDSIAVNGVCLTVKNLKKQSLEFDVMYESVKKTNLNTLKKNTKVNLERALKYNSRLDGHFVQGHIDCSAKLIDKYNTVAGVLLTFQHSNDFNVYTAPRGSIAINGVSLTIAAKQQNIFKVSIVKFTENNTNLIDLKVGDRVNLEFDILGKQLFEIYKNYK